MVAYNKKLHLHWPLSDKIGDTIETFHSIEKYGHTIFLDKIGDPCHKSTSKDSAGIYLIKADSVALPKPVSTRSLC